MLEAARIDGASEAKTFIDIVLPMVKPGIGALAIFTFINSWNDYFMQLIMLSSTSNLTISLGIAKLQAENSTDFGLIMAGAALAAVDVYKRQALRLCCMERRCLCNVTRDDLAEPQSPQHHPVGRAHQRERG